jgi:hypothetical protein
MESLQSIITRFDKLFENNQDVHVSSANILSTDTHQQSSTTDRNCSAVDASIIDVSVTDCLSLLSLTNIPSSDQQTEQAVSSDIVRAPADKKSKRKSKSVSNSNTIKDEQVCEE